MTAFPVLERLTLVCPLGVRFRDEATGSFVTDSLSVVVYPVSQPEQRVTGVANTTGVFVFRGLPGLRRIEFGDEPDLTPRFEFILEVRDRAGRYLPYQVAVLLPQRRILTIELTSPLASPLSVQVGREEGWLPLFSSPARSALDGLGTLRADLVDAVTGGPAAWALVEAKAGEQRLVTGMADREGRVMLPLFYPKPVITLGSPSSSNTPLTQQTWAVDFTVRYRRREPVPEIPDLVDVLTQPAATAWEQISPLSQWTQATLQFGRELRLATASGGAATATLLITPAGSPP
ncbi:MAG TPA: hypothetical protein VF432_09405 [Thermoanaerobaculia bacterium]